ncbi:hypothetical protein JXA40_00990 [bacterium]|nr:hypothetical protein [candidate division CSSED10-310 bacterium]
MAPNDGFDKDILNAERGSAFVLTLLFILLLTTMSTGIYLYSSQQALLADTNYTSVAASYIAEAGIEAGKSALTRQDMILDTAGQNPNGRIEKDDFPVHMPGPVQVGTYVGSSGRQGVGSYTTVIDAAFSDQIEMQFQLNRDISYISSNYDTGAVVPPDVGILNKLYSFVDCKVRLIQNQDELNVFPLSSQKEILWHLQIPGTSRYEWSFDQTMNPFAGRQYGLEIGRTPFDLSQPTAERDCYGNPLVLFPTSDGGGAIDCDNPEIDQDRVGGFALALGNHKDPNGTYLVHVYNPFHYAVEIRAVYKNITGIQISETLISAGSWTTTDVDRFAVIQFDGIHANLNAPTDPPYDVLNLTAKRIAIEVDAAGTMIPGQPITLTVSRGMNTPLSLSYRMRTVKMWETCSGGDPNAIDCCWFPDWPGSNCSLQSFASNIIYLGPAANYGTYDLNPDLEVLDREHSIRVDEMYTISSTGNVERATKARQIIMAPLSFLDYARFIEGNLVIGEGTSFTGLVYARGMIDLRADTGSDTVDFYEDVYTSNMFRDLNSLARWYGNAELKTFAPVQDLPDLNSLRGYYLNLVNPMSGGYGYTFPGGTELFLGNYDYRNKSNTFYGFYFVDPDPLDGDDVARYYPPGASILPEDSQYPLPYAPTGSGYIDLTHPTPSGNRIFNGVIYVNGDCTVWGKLSGRSLTIVAEGDITINREIVMGSDVVDLNYPHRCYGEGYPVHLALISVNPNSSSKIIVSRYCPRIMRIEAALMAVGGTWLVEDTDFAPGASPSAAGVDLDNSHPYYDIRPCGSFDTCWTNVANPGPIDLNQDGQITSSVYRWDENNVNVTWGHDYIWLLDINGPIITSSVAAPSHFQVRGTTNYNDPIAGRSRIYRYDPSIKFNPPPYFPIPRHSLKVLEWSTAVVELPS